MSTTTLSKTIQQIIEEQKIPYTELASRTKLSRQVLWMLTTGRRTPKASTLHVLITKGLRIKEGSPLYSELIGLWASDKTDGPHAKGVSVVIGRKKNEHDEMVRQILADVPTRDLPMIALALRDPAIRAILPRLLELRQRRGT